MALLLIQKKILTITESLEDETNNLLCLRNRKLKQNYQLPVVEINPQRLNEIQNELAERLFTDQPYETEIAETAETEQGAE